MPEIARAASPHVDGPYLDLDRHAWRGLRANTPMSLTAEALDELRGLTDPIQISEVEDVYLPLSRLLRLYFEATAGLRWDVRPAGGGIEPGPALKQVCSAGYC